MSVYRGLGRPETWFEIHVTSHSKNSHGSQANAARITEYEVQILAGGYDWIFWSTPRLLFSQSG